MTCSLLTLICGTICGIGVLHHVGSAILMTCSVSALPSCTMLTYEHFFLQQGSTVKAETTAGGMVMFNGVATVTTADIMVNDGMSIIHIIDTVLLPPMK